MMASEIDPDPEYDWIAPEDADWQAWAEQMTARGLEEDVVRYVLRLRQAWAVAA